MAASVQDLKQAMPELGRGLQQLLDFDGDVEATFARSFEVEYEFFGEMRSVELKPGGADIPVTSENRQEFVALMTDYYLNKSVSRQFSAFATGFHSVKALDLGSNAFNPHVTTAGQDTNLHSGSS